MLPASNAPKQLLTLPELAACTLGDLLGSGGEARVWQSGTQHAVKLFHEARLQGDERLKLKNKVAELIRTGAQAKAMGALPHVVWPECLVVNDEKSFVGYRMPRVTGTAIHLVCKDEAWTMTQRLAVALQLARCVAGLHAASVAVGDLSWNNVLVELNNGRVFVWVIDSDSFHLPAFPCLVATPRYMLPAALREPDTFRAGPEADNHAMAVLLFELLLGGVSPFAHKGGEDTEEDDIKKQFCAFVQEAARVPDAPRPWLQRWRALPESARAYFARAFVPGHGIRPTAAEWTALLSTTSFPLHWPDMCPPAASAPVAVPARATGLTWLCQQFARRKSTA